MPNEWIEIEPVSGRDSGQIILRYGNNDTSSGRSATIRIWNSDFKITATTVITQSICPSEITGITLNASWVNDVPASGGTADKDNCTYNVMGLLDDGNTRNVTNLSNVYGSLTVPASKDENRHSVGTLTLNAEYQNFTDSANVIVYQAGYEIPTGTTDGCDVEAIYDVTSTTKPTKLYDLRGDNSGEIDYFTIDDNPTQYKGNSVYDEFTFDTTGNHTVHYHLTGDTVGNHFFIYCSSLSSVVIGTGVTSIANNCFGGCTGLTSIEIPDNVTSLGQSCFVNCSSLSSATIGTGVTSLSDYCFEECTSLSSIEIPDSVTSLGWGCFAYCDSLSSVAISTVVTSIGNGCFYNCKALSSITCLPTVPPTSGSNMFGNTNCPIYVPDASVDAYKSAWIIYAGRIFPLSQKPSENGINVSSNIEWDTNISEQ